VAWTDDGLARPDESGSLTALRGLDEVGEVDLMVATETSPPMVTLLEEVVEAADVVVDRWLGCSLDTADLFWRTVTRARRPVVIVLTPDHLRDPSWGRARMRTPGLLRHAVERATLVVAPGRHLAQWAVEAGAADVMLIPPAAELTAAPAPLGPWRGRIAVPGADAPRADQERLAAVMASVDERVELGPITWVVLGPLPAELREHPRVEVRSASPVEIIEAAVDAAILPFDPEESPITRSLHPWRRLAGVGIPVAVTRGGGLDAIIRDHEDGLLVDPDGWGDAVDRLRDPSLRQALAASARVRVAEQFSSERAARLWIRSIRIAREAAPEASSMQGIL
jgi:glycosyltransferase involved in cell wall biosynthesis